jgi:5'-nucleotidase (lipoprotein e(P4) family)
MKNLWIFMLMITVLLTSCYSPDRKRQESAYRSDRLLASVNWFRNSAEMTALYIQGYNIAHERLDEAICSGMPEKPMAVVVDIDETVLDNSPFEVSVILNGETRDGWTDWTNKASAAALPGALEFLKYAHSKKVAVFYITNRDSSERQSTLRNLDSLGFPNATGDYLLTRNDTSFSKGNTSSKAGRRAKVSATHEIILFIGDNLNDFSELFEDRSMNFGKNAVMENKELFGRKYIVLPNPMYGAWEKPVYDYEDGLSESGKADKMREKLK